MGQSFKFISCLSSEFCRDYHCMLQGHHSVIRASQCTEHWVSAIQNILRIDPCALILAFKRTFILNKSPPERVKETSPLGSGNSRSLEDIIKQARMGLGQQDIQAADNLNRNPGLIFTDAKKQCLFIQSHSAAEADG